MKKSILDHRLVSKRYFFPRKTDFADPLWIECGNARLGCHYQEKNPKAKTLVHFHGSGEVVADN
ncbi:alpha/beta hydrolase, partial [Desulfobacterales bacterium HSG2]|nr:alpha/beta hydrolase [Desulfobacterales bacterium HSG2]